MSDNIPFDIQMEIIKKVYDVKSLIRFRSVSKPWRSFIDSSDFIKGYGVRHMQPHSRILRYEVEYLWKEEKYMCLVDDDNETFKVQQELAPSVVSRLLKQYRVLKVVGACHGLLCLFCWDVSLRKNMVVIWNPSIRKSVGIAPPYEYPDIDIQIVYGFGVCPVTRDPTVVRIKQRIGMPWHVEFFTLSSRVWNVIPSRSLPYESIRFMSSQVVIDRFIYWGISDNTFANAKYRVVSFDLITKEFKVVDLPYSLKNKLNGTRVFVSKLRESLVVSGNIYARRARCCGVWVMEHDSSLRKLFTIGARVSKILGFSKSGEIIFETSEWFLNGISTINVYNPCSKQIKNLGIFGLEGSFFMGSYKESLLLLDHSDLHIHSDDN